MHTGQGERTLPRPRDNFMKWGIVQSMFKKLKRSAEGAGVPHVKATAGVATVKMPAPDQVTLLMSQHIGAPATPVVQKGDTG